MKTIEKMTDLLFLYSTVEFDIVINLKKLILHDKIAF